MVGWVRPSGSVSSQAQASPLSSAAPMASCQIRPLELRRWCWRPNRCILAVGVNEVLLSNLPGGAMADDLVSTEPAGGPSAELGDNKVGDQWKKGWRSLFLLGVTFALVLLGYVFWKASAIGKEAPEYIPYSPTHYCLFHRPKSDDSFDNGGVLAQSERLPPASALRNCLRLGYELPNAKNSPAIFIASSLRPVALMRDADGKLEVKSDQSYRRAVFYNGIDKYRALRPIEYVSELSLADITKNGRGERFGFPVATVELPQITQESRGSFFAHLPLIGIIAGSSYKLPFLISEDGSSSDDENLIEFPRLKNGRYPSYPDYGSGPLLTTGHLAVNILRRSTGNQNH